HIIVHRFFITTVQVFENRLFIWPVNFDQIFVIICPDLLSIYDIIKGISIFFNLEYRPVCGFEMDLRLVTDPLLPECLICQIHDFLGGAPTFDWRIGMSKYRTAALERDRKSVV